jgi:VanZ family protein
MLLVYWVAMFTGTHLPTLAFYLAEAGLEISDIYMHLVAYAGWSGLWCWVLAGGGRVRWRSYVWLFILGTAYAVFDEGTQALVGRTPAVNDLVADVFGLVIGMAAAHTVFTWSRRQA